jgi:alkaline phosphatase
LRTLLEHFKAGGKAVGLVTTTSLTHATPAAFGAHEPSRTNVAAIAADYLRQTRPNVLFGGGGKGLTVSATESAGYVVVTNAAGFSVLDPDRAYLSAQFGDGKLPYKHDYPPGEYPLPSLSRMTAVAIEAMQLYPEGFFLMVEGGRIDSACHGNHLERAVHETLDFAEAVQTAADWAAGRTDTLILVTADHETGGLKVEQDMGPGRYPVVRWSSRGHTAANVPVYAWGPKSEMVRGVMDNTEMFRVCTSDVAPTPEPVGAEAGNCGRWRAASTEAEGLMSLVLEAGTWPGVELGGAVETFGLHMGSSLFCAVGARVR